MKYENIENGYYYHIFNRGINSCDIFKETTNYEHFLRLYEKYIHPIADTYAWVLMKNHFHFLVRIKEKENVGFYKKINSDRSNDSVRFQTTFDLSEFEENDRIKCPDPTKHFSHLFSSYAKYYNARSNRHGSLFERPFHRIKIENEKYLRNLIFYIHNNPVHHGFADNINGYPWSSYQTIISTKETKIKRKESIELFDNLANFKTYHVSWPSLIGMDYLLID